MAKLVIIKSTEQAAMGFVRVTGATQFYKSSSFALFLWSFAISAMRISKDAAHHAIKGGGKTGGIQRQ